MPAENLKFTVTCLEGPGCTVYFEPEGAEIPLSSGGLLRVELTWDGDGGLEISHVPDGLVIGAHWTHSTTRVWDRGGRQLEPVERLSEHEAVE